MEIVGEVIRRKSLRRFTRSRFNSNYKKYSCISKFYNLLLYNFRSDTPLVEKQNEFIGRKRILQAL